MERCCRDLLYAPILQRIDDQERRPPLTKQPLLPLVVYVGIVHHRSGSG